MKKSVKAVIAAATAAAVLFGSGAAAFAAQKNEETKTVTEVTEEAKEETVSSNEEVSKETEEKEDILSNDEVVYVFTDANGEKVNPIGGEMKNVAHADFSGLLPELRDAEITVICDVTNPLLGPDGATFIYGPQKGATPEIRDALEAGMARFAAVVSEAAGRDIASFPGAGAAGGLGAALSGVLGAKLKTGIDAVLDAVDFEEKLNGVSLAVTGEGRMDGQSVRFGKVPVGVAKRCAARGIPTVAIVGGIGDGAEGLFDLCESTIQTTVSGPMSLEKAMKDAPAL